MDKEMEEKKYEAPVVSKMRVVLENVIANNSPGEEPFRFEHTELDIGLNDDYDKTINKDSGYDITY